VAAIVAALFALACFGFCWLYHGTVVDVRQLVIDDMRRLSATQIRERAYVPALDARGQSGLPN
jgi:hypothetical protein